VLSADLIHLKGALLTMLVLVTWLLWLIQKHSLQKMEPQDMTRIFWRNKKCFLSQLLFKTKNMVFQGKYFFLYLLVLFHSWRGYKIILNCKTLEYSFKEHKDGYQLSIYIRS